MTRADAIERKCFLLRAYTDACRDEKTAISAELDEIRRDLIETETARPVKKRRTWHDGRAAAAGRS